MSYRVAIVGAGPIGIEMAIALKKYHVPFIHFDKEQIGQMIYNFPPQTRFFSSNERISIAGVPIQTVDQTKCTREEYLAYLRQLVMHYQLDIRTFEKVIAIEKLEATGFSIQTEVKGEKHSYTSELVILATGGTSFPRLLGIPGEDLPHVSAKFVDPHLYFNKNVVIIGSKNSAVESALRCYHAGAKVTLVSRREQFDDQEIKYWLLPELKSCLKRKEIVHFGGVEPAKISADKVTLRSIKTQQEQDIASDFVIKAIGFQADMSLFKKLGVALIEGEHHPLVNEATMETSVPGVFVLGTAIAGTQAKFRVFIENTHEHVEKILAALLEVKPSLPFKKTLTPLEE